MNVTPLLSDKAAPLAYIRARHAVGEIRRLDEARLQAAIGDLETAEEAVADAAWVLYALAAESLPVDEVDELRDEAHDAANALLDILERVDLDDDAPERALELLRDLADRRASAREVSRARQDGAALVPALVDVSDDIEYERRELEDELYGLDDDDDEANDD